MKYDVPKFYNIIYLRQFHVPHKIDVSIYKKTDLKYYFYFTRLVRKFKTDPEIFSKFGEKIEIFFQNTLFLKKQPTVWLGQSAGWSSFT